MKINELDKIHISSLIFFQYSLIFNILRQKCIFSFNFQVFEERASFYLLIQIIILYRKENTHFKIRYWWNQVKIWNWVCEAALGATLVILFPGTCIFCWFAPYHRSVLKLNTQITIFFLLNFLQLTSNIDFFK